MSAGNERGEVFGGHLNQAFVSATCEMVIQIMEGKVDRRFDKEKMCIRDSRFFHAL